MNTLNDYAKKNAEIQKKNAVEAADTAGVYQSISDTYSGRKAIEDLTRRFNHDQCFAPGTNLNDACYFEGQRSVINYINQQLNYRLTNHGTDNTNNK